MYKNRQVLPTAGNIDGALPDFFSGKSSLISLSKLPQRRRQLYKNCSHIVIMMIQIYWKNKGFQKTIIPAQGLNVPSYEGPILPDLIELLSINSNDKGAKKQGLASAVDFTTILQALNYKSYSLLCKKTEDIQQIIRFALKEGIPIALGIDVNKVGLPAKKNGRFHHGIYLFAEYTLKGKEYYVYAHGHSKVAYSDKKRLLDSCANLFLNRKWQNRFILTIPTEYTIKTNALKNLITKFKEEPKNKITPSIIEQLASKMPENSYIESNKLLSFTSKLTELFLQLRNILVAEDPFILNKFYHNHLLPNMGKISFIRLKSLKQHFLINTSMLLVCCSAKINSEPWKQEVKDYAMHSLPKKIPMQELNMGDTILKLFNHALDCFDNYQKVLSKIKKANSQHQKNIRKNCFFSHPRNRKMNQRNRNSVQISSSHSNGCCYRKNPVVSQIF